jgi:hypothetical protein
MDSARSLFAAVIEDHLELKRRNAALEGTMPIDTFLPRDPFDNNALFKTEHEAQLEEAETGEHPAITLEWPGMGEEGEVEEAWLDRNQCSDFNWGD